MFFFLFDICLGLKGTVQRLYYTSWDDQTLRNKYFEAKMEFAFLAETFSFSSKDVDGFCRYDLLLLFHRYSNKRY